MVDFRIIPLSIISKFPSAGYKGFGAKSQIAEIRLEIGSDRFHDKIGRKSDLLS